MDDERDLIPTPARGRRSVPLPDDDLDTLVPSPASRAPALARTRVISTGAPTPGLSNMALAARILSALGRRCVPLPDDDLDTLVPSPASRAPALARSTMEFGTRVISTGAPTPGRSNMALAASILSALGRPCVAPDDRDILAHSTAAPAPAPAPAPALGASSLALNSTAARASGPQDASASTSAAPAPLIGHTTVSVVDPALRRSEDALDISTAPPARAPALGSRTLQALDDPDAFLHHKDIDALLLDDDVDLDLDAGLLEINWSIRVRLLVMPGGQSTLLDVYPAETVDQLRPRIAAMAAQLQPPESYSFRHGGQTMEENEMLLIYGVLDDGDTIQIIPN